MIPAGTILTYQAQITASGWFQSTDAVILQMNRVFSQSNIKMIDYHVAGEILDTIKSYVTGYLNIQLTATLQTSVDFNAVDDIRGIADHGIYMAVDAMPTSTIPNITLPGMALPPGTIGVPTPGATLPTGESIQTGTGSNVPHKCGDPSWGLTDDPGQYIQCLFSGITGTVMLLVLTILGVVLILAGRTKSISARGASFG